MKTITENKEIKEGRKCTSCNTKFCLPHGFPVLCEPCWHDLYRKNLKERGGNMCTDADIRRIIMAMTQKAMHRRT